MALEAVVYQEFGYNNNNNNKKDVYNLLGGLGLAEEQEVERFVGFVDFPENQTENYRFGEWNSPAPSQWGSSSSIEPEMGNTLFGEEFPAWDNNSTAISARPKRRRSKGKKNIEEIENQRMTHIAVERNRRKQMNDYLSVLRDLMPDSYVQKGDQASIIGGAINYVKELEQQLHFLSGQKNVNQNSTESSPSPSPSPSPSSSLPFGEFFTFPQYSTDNQLSAAVADIEVSMVESHASLKIRSKRQPKQLLKMVAGLQRLRLTVIHLNVTTVDPFVLYSLSLKVEDDCNLTSVDEIATAVNQILGRIQAEASLI